MANTNKPTGTQIANTANEAVRNLKTEYPEIRDIRNDLSSLKNNISGLAQHAMENGSDSVAALKERAGKELDKAVVVGKDGIKRLEGRVRERPGQSLLAAFAAGIVLSFLFGRK